MKQLREENINLKISFKSNETDREATLSGVKGTDKKIMQMLQQFIKVNVEFSFKLSVSACKLNNKKLKQEPEFHFNLLFGPSFWFPFNLWIFNFTEMFLLPSTGPLSQCQNKFNSFSIQLLA